MGIELFPRLFLNGYGLAIYRSGALPELSAVILGLHSPKEGHPFIRGCVKAVSPKSGFEIECEFSKLPNPPEFQENGITRLS